MLAPMLGKKFLKAISRHGPLRVIKRYVIWLGYSLGSAHKGFLWPFMKTEDSNFYYPLTRSGELELAQFIGVACDVTPEQVLQLFRELKEDAGVAELVSGFKASTPEMRDSALDFGRRLGWYAIVRIRKPRVVLETGVHNGLGGLAVLAALRKNIHEGFEGQYVGIDLNPKAGSLFRDSDFALYGEVKFGDSIEVIESLSMQIDLAITDSNHSDGYEKRELDQIERKLSPRAWVVSDNAHVTEVLQSWSIQKGNRYLIWIEKTDHWSRGAAIGLSWPPG